LLIAGRKLVKFLPCLLRALRARKVRRVGDWRGRFARVCRAWGLCVAAGFPESVSEMTDPSEEAAVAVVG